MTCDDAKKQLILFLYGELSFDAEEAVEQHLEVCPACRTESARERKMMGMVDDAAVDVPAGMLTDCRRSLRLRLDAGTQVRSAAPWWRKWLSPSSAWLKPAGAVALVALGFVAARLTAPAGGWRPQAPAEIASARVRSIEPGEGGRVQLVVEETRQRVMNGRLDDEPIRQLLLAATKDPSDPGLRVESVGLLNSRSAMSDVRNALLAALQQDDNAGVRLKALEGLRAYAGDTETRRVLSKVLLTDDNPGIRTQAIDLLTQRQGPDVAGVLQELLKREDNNYVRQRSQKALRDMNASVEVF